MATRKVTARLEGEGLRFLARTATGHAVVMDDARGDTGPSPAELLVVAQAGCAAMDVVSILRKSRQPIEGYEIRVYGQQREDRWPHVFEEMRIVHVVDGPVDVGALRRAIELSATKYCTVSANLAAGVTRVHHAFILRDRNGPERLAEVLVTGPGASLDGPVPAAVGLGPKPRLVTA